MRSSLNPRSLILLASAALSFGACAGTETTPGMTMNPTMAGTPASTAAGMSGTAGATAGSPASGTAGGGTTTAGTGGSTTMVTAGMSAGTAGMGAGEAGMSGGAGMGSTAGMGGAAGGAADGGPVTFTKVFEDVLLGTGCGVGACHGSPMTASKLGLADKTQAYTGLVGVMAMGMPNPGATTDGCAGKDFVRVKAGDPDNSLLIQKLEGKQMCGTEMPVGGMLKPEQIKLVRDWIMAGAKDD